VVKDGPESFPAAYLDEQAMEIRLLSDHRRDLVQERTRARRQRERHAPVTDDGELAERHTPPGITHDQVERHERLRQGAEALHRLKPQEARALRLKAEGYTYKEICRITGWTYTKVNRCLTEGRQALRHRAAGIEVGDECRRLAPLLSDATGHMVGTGDVRGLGRHLRNCVSCRARLRSLRANQCEPRNERSLKVLREAA
jgi:hypothetical protein